MSVKRVQSGDCNSSFKVFIRIRPHNAYELQASTTRECMNYNQNEISVKIRNDNQLFTFDRVFHPIASQEEVFETVADDIIDNAFMGINGTIFCYGQTASGKTHTIVGDYASQFSQNQGLLPRILREVVQRKNTKIQNVKQSNLDIRIKVSMVEIYNEKIVDLFDLNKRDLKLRQNKKQGVFIENVSEKYIVNAEEAINYVKLGLENRTVGRTNLNAYSSRSHMVFIITIHETNFQTREAKSAKITLTDLAGSEKLSKTGVEGKMLIEAKKINTSLSTLGKVIQALSEKSNHVPYRDSKLTRLLQQSIGGNSLTRLIINVSPSKLNEYETITSLRFGSRAKLIKNKPKVNKQYTVEELLILLEKAELKIKQQMKIIEELQQGHSSSHFLRRNGGYAGLGGYEKSITLHMIGDDDEEFDDSSSVGSQSMVKSVASHQDNCNVSIFGESGVFFNRTSDFEFQPSSTKKKGRKPNLCYSKSMKALPSLDLEQDEQQENGMLFGKKDQVVKKEKKTVTILEDNILDEHSEGEDGNGVIYEENESCKDESLKNSTGQNFELLCKSINKAQIADIPQSDHLQQTTTPNEVDVPEQEKLQKTLNKGEGKKLSDITNSESTNANNQASLPSSSTSRSLSKSPKDREKEKENEITLIREELKEQLKEQLKQQLKQQIKEQLKQQLKEQLKEQLRQEIQQKVKEQFKGEIQALHTKVETMTVQLKTTQTKFEEIKVKYEQTVHVIEEQRQSIKTKEQHIVELKEKYKAKKNQINKEINKLKNFWQGGV